jgi:hypothetical protein
LIFSPIGRQTKSPLKLYTDSPLAPPDQIATQWAKTVVSHVNEEVRTSMLLRRKIEEVIREEPDGKTLGNGLFMSATDGVVHASVTYDLGNFFSPATFTIDALTIDKCQPYCGYGKTQVLSDPAFIKRAKEEVQQWKGNKRQIKSANQTFAHPRYLGHVPFFQLSLHCGRSSATIAGSCLT